MTTKPTYLIHQGDALQILPELKYQFFDLVVADHPYSSGGAHRSDRNATPRSKYQKTKTATEYPPFFGDNKDMMSFLMFNHGWLHQCWQLTKPGGSMLVFTDWRQLSAMMIGVQMSNWTLRGLIPWDKGRAARLPHTGYFRTQCEYIVWATNGHCPLAEHKRISYDGFYPDMLPLDILPDNLEPYYTAPISPKEKQHVTAKPLELMKPLVDICPPDGWVLDPFMGSGTTLVASLMTGKNSMGIEMSKEYCEIAERRCQEVLGQYSLSKTYQEGLF